MMMRMLGSMEEKRNELLAKLRSKLSLSESEMAALQVLDANKHMFEMTATIDDSRIKAVYAEFQDAMAGKLQKKESNNPIAAIYDKRNEIIARAKGDPQKLKAELKKELDLRYVAADEMLAKLAVSRLTEPLKELIREEYNHEVNAFRALKKERDKLTANDTNEHLSDKEKDKDRDYLSQQVTHLKRAIYLDAQMQYGHAEGLNNFLDAVHDRLGSVYNKRVDRPSYQKMQEKQKLEEAQQQANTNQPKPLPTSSTPKQATSKTQDSQPLSTKLDDKKARMASSNPPRKPVPPAPDANSASTPSEAKIEAGRRPRR